MALTKPKLSQNIDTDISVFSDPILVLHQGSSLADVDVGFLMNRSNGLTANAAVIWQESSKSFVHILTTSSGVADANLTVQSYANVSVGNVLLINNAGIYVDGTIGSAGQVLASDGSKTYWAPPGGFTGGTVPNPSVFQSNLVISNTTPSTSNVTGALVVAGGAGIAGNLYVSNISVGSGNIQFAQKSGMISGATAYLSLLGNPSGSAGISALELAGYTGVAGGTQSRLDFVSKVSNVFYNTSRISSINGPSSTGAGQLVFSTTPDGGSLTERLRIKDDGPIVTAANIVAVGSATSNTTTGAIVVVGGIGLSGGIIAGGNIVAAAVTNSVSTTTGALVVRGGAGIAGNVYANVYYIMNSIRWAGNGAVFESGGTPGGSNTNIQYNNAGVFAGASNFTYTAASGNVVVGTSTPSTSTTTGALVVGGGTGIAGNLYVGSTATQSILLNSYPLWSANSVRQTPRWTTSSTTPVGSILGDMWYDSSTDILYEYINDGTNNIWVDVSSAFSNNFVILSGVTVTATGNAQATNTTTGDLQVTGGASINTGNLYIGGSGGRSITATGNVVITGTASTSTTSGALVVAGGAGISGALHIQHTGDVSANIGAYQTYANANVAATQANIGAFYNYANTKIGNNTNSNLVVAATTTSTSTTTGALVVGGGIGITGNIFTAGWIIPSSNVSQNLGTTTSWWNLIYGRSVQAQYADLAENYEGDELYTPATVVVFGGSKEITVSNVSHDTRIAGVVSTNPAYLMNAINTGTPVALTGKVPCKVKGPISKGSILVNSDIDGVAMKLDMANYQPGCVIGKSLEDILDDSVQIVNIAVGRF